MLVIVWKKWKIFWKHNNKPNQIIGTPKSSLVAQGLNDFHLHISGFELVLCEYIFYLNIFTISK